MFRTIQEITLSSQLATVNIDMCKNIDIDMCKNIDIFIRTTHIMFNCSIIMSCAAVGQLLLFFFVMPILQKEKRKREALCIVSLILVVSFTF